MRLLCLILLFTGALWGASVPLTAQAHQQKAAITTVLFNHRTANIEVAHRFYMHDAEHAVQTLLGAQADILSNEQDQARFADYALQRFSLRHEGKILPLSLVGFEVEGKFFWVYQETPAPEHLGTLAVNHGVLQDIWSNQVNTVNFEGLGKIRTLTFTQPSELLKVEFQRAH